MCSYNSPPADAVSGKWIETIVQKEYLITHLHFSFRENEWLWSLPSPRILNYHLWVWWLTLLRCNGLRQHHILLNILQGKWIWRVYELWEPDIERISCQVVWKINCSTIGPTNWLRTRRKVHFIHYLCTFYLWETLINWKGNGRCTWWNWIWTEPIK